MNPKTKKLLWAIAIGLVLANIGTLVLVVMQQSKIDAQKEIKTSTMSPAQNSPVSRPLPKLK